MSAMETPERALVMHQPVVPVEPEVYSEAVQGNFHGKPPPLHRGWKFLLAIGQDDDEHGADVASGDEREENFLDVGIWDAISLMLVTVEKSMGMA